MCQPRIHARAAASAASHSEREVLINPCGQFVRMAVRCSLTDKSHTCRLITADMNQHAFLTFLTNQGTLLFAATAIQLHTDKATTRL